jgi:quinohemoprotein ethanol dehydrogenase
LRSIPGIRLIVCLSILSMSGLVAPAGALAADAQVAPARVSLDRLEHADHEPGQWMVSGRDLGGSFYSPLAQIDRKSVDRLGFAWQFKTGTFRGTQATPVAVDGTLYFSGTWGAVYAVDAATGSKRWAFEPPVDHSFARWSGMDAQTRGVAVWNGWVYVVSTDCQLFALDARTGKTAWQTSTLTAGARGYTCTGAPVVAGKFVVVGNGLSENDPKDVRGYVSAFDPKNGKLAWRFNVVPSVTDRNPTPEMRIAAQTWDPKRDPAYGGGGNAWAWMAYDAKLDLIYFGTGNPTPWSADRDWSGTSRDRLYTDSIVALRASSGRMAWYYQTTPGDIWDYDSAMNVVLATLTLEGKERRVLLQANKNGYFYVLDRGTGHPISVSPFAYMNWASGIDASFRPVVPRESDYSKSGKVIYPSAVGAHSWQPMSYSPATGLVYIPTLETGNIMINVQTDPSSQLSDVDQSLGVELIFPDKTLSYDFWQPILGAIPKFPTTPPAGGTKLVRSLLRAFDPVKGRIAWEQQTSEDVLVMDGGAISTAGGLVFAGREDGMFIAYDASTGKILKQIDTGTPIMAAPMTYMVEGRQYVAVLGGHGGQYLSFLGTSSMKYVNEARLLAFALDGSGEVPKPPIRPEMAYNDPPAPTGSPALVNAGRNLYLTYCVRCHTLGTPAVTPDLSRSNVVASIDAFKAVVLNGALLARGMPRWDDTLTSGDAEALQSYFIDEWRKAYAAQAASKSIDPINRPGSGEHQ